ncbi:TrbC/VirB2 family protein [Asticcacaulis sp. ZE23SCel15]|uniref:TrbC/VirB2 family protein n=1 Tax=Asticcacaulis sp. ZE23SCel15 TaxID=3059027 RepID=UPI00265E4588|nr:TrbC/VirB2 family protein [Asticcacaulis sp. ZE23SCel15]WKL58313.1 TrbC/VirB2 family protein [Asticcacaulis sp. ZE23SCel15]
MKRPSFLAPVAALLAYAISATTAAAQTAQTNPQGSSPILGAVNWIQGTLLGNVATAVGVIAVAAVGFMMLTGRMNWRFGATVILGLFILFGAATIVAGIQSAAG